MFKSINYIDQENNSNTGYPYYVYQLHDTDFVTYFKVSDRTRSRIVGKIAEVYQKQNKPVAHNIARYYYSHFSPGANYMTVVELIKADSKLISKRNPSSQFDQLYVRCILNQITTIAWARKVTLRKK